MKNILLLLVIPSILILSSCGGSKKDEVVIPPGMRIAEFKIAGNILNMFVPDSTKGTLEITEMPWGATQIKVGDAFQLSVEEGAGDIKLLKDDINGDDVYKLQKFIKDEPALVFWETKIPDLDKSNKFHFYNIIKAGNVSYVIKDVETGEVNTQAAVEQMIESAKSLKAKDAATPNS